MRKLILAACGAWISCAVFASPSYIVPWYANPAATNVVFEGSLVKVLDETDAPLASAWATVAADGAIAGANVVAKRMSHTTYFRPRLYALLDTGNIVVYTLTNDCSAVKWRTVLTAAELAAAAGVAEGSVASDLQVSDDGALGFLKYGDGYRALGYATPVWTLHVRDASGNEVTDAATAISILDEMKSRTSAPGEGEAEAYITDGRWELYVNRQWSGHVRTGIGAATGNYAGNGHRNSYSGEYLDLSAGVAQLGNIVGKIDNRTYINLLGHKTNFLLDGRLRVFIPSRSNQVLRFAFMTPCTSVEEYVVCNDMVENASAANDQAFASITGCIQRLVWNFPSMKRYQGTTQYFMKDSCRASDLADFGFPVLTNVSQRMFAHCEATGTLDLPNVAIVDDADSATVSAFGYSKMSEIRLSAETRALQVLGARAFRTDYSLKRIVIGGVAGGFRFKGGNTTMFVASSAIKDIIFTGGHPIFDAGTTKISDNQSSDSKAKNIVFAHPPLDDATYGAEWSEFLAGKTITPLTAAERAAFKAANPGRPVPYGVADKSVFLTSYDQYIALVGSEDDDTGCSLEIAHDTFFGDAVTVTGAAELEEGSGLYPEGTTVTLTAVPGAGGAFRKWYGDIGTNDATAASITLTLTRNTKVHARFVHPWTISGYDASARTAKASNGNFTINLTDMDAATHTFTLGKAERFGLHDLLFTANGDGSVTTNLAGSGVLDLGGAFSLPGDGVAWRAKAVANATGSMTYPLALSGQITAFFSPGTLTERMPRVFYVEWDVRTLATSYAKIVIDEPDLPMFFNNNEFACYSTGIVRDFVLQVPKLQDIYTQAFYYGTMEDVDVTYWDLSSITNLGSKSLLTQSIGPQAAGSGHYGRRLDLARGTLTLPCLRTVTTSDTDGSALAPMPNITAISLGGGTAKLTVTRIGCRAFAGNSSLTNLTLHADADIEVGTDIFADCDGSEYGIFYAGHTPETIVFTGDPPRNESAIANLLGCVRAGDAPVKIRAQMFTRGWNALPYIDYSPTAAEKALAGEESTKVFGVYRTTTGGVSYVKALLLRTRAPSGLSVHFR